MKLRRILSLIATFALSAGFVVMGTAPARALTVTLGNTDELVFDHTAGKYTNIIGTGTANNDVVLYKNVVTVSGISVDAVITTTLSGGTISNYDAIGNASSNASNFQLNAAIGTAGGTITANFAFFEAGTYTGANTGNPVILQNVKMTSIDIDASGSSDFQFTEFTGFQKYTLNSPTNLTVSNTNPPKVRFTATSNNNNSSIPEDKVMAKYDSVHTLDVVMGNIKVASINYFGIAFGPWTGGSPVEYVNTYNSPPTSSNTSTNVAASVRYIIPKSMFGTYADVDNNPFNQVIIKTLPASGTLQYLSGGSWTNVTANQVISIADIELGKLSYTGSSNTSFTFQVHDGLAYSTSTYTATLVSVTTAQTITFANPGSKTPSQTFASGATASSGLTVTLTSLTPGICTVSGLNITTVTSGQCEIVATQAGNSTYGAAAPVTQIFPVTTLAAQTITFANPGDKSISAGSVVSGATASSGLTVTLTSLTPSVCTISGLTIVLVSKGTCQVKATQAGNGTYGPAPPVTQTFQVTGISITITAPSVTVNYGDPVPTLGSPTFGSGFINGDTSSVLTTQPTCVTTYTATSDVGSSATTSCSGAVADNYVFTYVDTPVTINQAPVIVTASSTSVQFGSSVPTITASYSGFKNSQGAGVLDTAPTCVTTYSSTTNYGTTPSTSCSGAADTNYSFTYVNGSIAISRAPLTVTGSSHAISVGASVPTVTASYSGFKGSDSASVVSGQSCATVYTTSSAAGNYATTCSGGTATNYTITYVDGVVTATSGSNSSQTITFPNPGSQTYGPSFTLGTPPSSSSALSVTITSNSPSVCTVSGNVVTIVGIGTCSLTANQGGGSTGGTTYNPATPVTITFSVNAAPLTVTASSPTVTYGDGIPSITYTISGFVLSDTASVLTTVPTCSTNFVSTDGISASRTTTCSGAAASNYSFTYTGGTVTINRAPLTVTASSHSVFEGDAIPSITASYTGWVLSQSISNVTITGQSCLTTYTTSSAIGTYPSSCSGGSTSNYTITYVNGSVVASSAVSILSQVITFSNPGTKQYGGSNFTVSPTATSGLPVTTYSNTPEVCGVSGSTISLLHAGQCSLSASQPGNSTYLAAPQVTQVFTVSKARIRVTASSYTVAKGTIRPSIYASYSGFENGDNSSVISGVGCSTSYSSLSNVGQYATSCSGGQADDYTFSYVDGSIVVVAAAVTPSPTPSPTIVVPTPTPTPTPSPTLGVLPTSVLQIPTSPDGKPLADVTKPASIDLGDGMQEAKATDLFGPRNGSNQSVRTLTQLATESLGGFAPGVGTMIEVIGARTTGQFIVANTSVADPIAVAKALEESIARNSVDFAAVASASAVASPDLKLVIGGDPTKDALDTFAASDLANPRTIGQLNVQKATKWINVQASVTTYTPGSIVYLAVTTEPVIFGAAVVDRYGKANISGLLPIDALSAGGHNIRVVGSRSLAGVYTDDAGEIQLAQATMDEIQRFDQGTKATIKVIGANTQGGLHAVIREVPLMKYEPWWTVWFATWTAFLLLLARRYGKIARRNEKIMALGLMTIATLPSLYAGWVTSTYAIMLWGSMAGLIGAAGIWYLPIRGTREDQIARRRIKDTIDDVEARIDDLFDGKNN